MRLSCGSGPVQTTAAIPVIAVSASTMREEVGRIREVCNAFLSKPVRKDDLIRTMAEFLACRTVEDPDPVSPVQHSNDPAPEGIGSGSRAPVKDRQRIDKWKTLFEILDRRMNERPCETGGVIVIDRLETLGGQMRELGRIYDYPQLSEWAEQLLTQAESIDVKGLPKTLERLPRLVDALRSHVDS